MPRVKKVTKQEQFESMLNQFREVADKRNLREETVLETFEKSYEKAIAKRNGGEGVNVKVSLNRMAYEFEVFVYKKVVEKDEDIKDDALEITLTEALKLDENAVVGSDVVILHDYLSNLSSEIGRAGYQNFLQRLVELEKEQLTEMYRGKIGELIVGTIETAKNNRTTYVNIGQTSVPLDEKHLINGEKFSDGTLVPFFVVDVVADPKGAKIVLSRTDVGFVKALLSREVHEIYDGTVVIHDIVREPGERCKIAVSTNPNYPNVDPVGACIGPSGNRIQKVTAELGPSGKKEKIDIIPFSDNIGLYIFEAFRPAVPLGVSVDTVNKSAKVVFEMGEKGKALGQKGANIRLAKKLTGYDLVIMELDEANTNGVTFKNKEQLMFEQNIADQEKAWQVRRDAQLEAMANELAKAEETFELETPVTQETPVAPVEVAPVIATVVTEEAKPVPVVEPVKVEVAPVIEKVKTTISLADLEKELEQEKAQPKAQQRTFKRRKDKQEDEAVTITTIDAPKLDIYTEEELRELEEQEKQHEGEFVDDIDYDEFDEYYEE